jgi:hypothetical protein
MTGEDIVLMELAGQKRKKMQKATLQELIKSSVAGIGKLKRVNSPNCHCASILGMCLGYTAFRGIIEIKPYREAEGRQICVR